VGNRPAYGDVRLEAATFAVGQLDAVLSYHPPLSVWMFWGQFVAFPHGLPLKVGATLSLAERGGDITALAYAVELHSWTVQPRAAGSARQCFHPPKADQGGATGADRRPGNARLNRPGRQPGRDPRRPALVPSEARHYAPAVGVAGRQRRAEARRV
jgi:hypothetical protein